MIALAATTRSGVRRGELWWGAPATPGAARSTLGKDQLDAVNRALALCLSIPLRLAPDAG